jgi:hypothetical protein
MATFAAGQNNSTNEIKTFTIDFTNDLPSGGTVTAGTATHIPPSGSASTISTAVSSPYLYATLPAQTVKGLHYIDVLGTFNNSDKSSVRIPVYILYPDVLARTGMVDLIADLRGLTDANVDDYTIAGIPYWSDKQLQDILDNNRTDFKWAEMTAQEEGDSTWLDYTIGWGNFEQTSGGTAIFIVQDIRGDTVSASGYSVDYRRGVVTFNTDTGGTDYFVTGRSYDLNGAAADVWRRKLVHYHTAVDFKTDNTSIDRSQLYKNAQEMVAYFEGMASGGFASIDVLRSDTDVI